MEIDQIATKADVKELKILIEDIRKSLANSNAEKIILRSSDVRKFLNISDGTLQRLRITNMLPAHKVNGTWFYKYEDVVKMIDND